MSNNYKYACWKLDFKFDLCTKYHHNQTSGWRVKAWQPQQFSYSYGSYVSQAENTDVNTSINGYWMSALLAYPVQSFLYMLHCLHTGQDILLWWVLRSQNTALEVLQLVVLISLCGTTVMAEDSHVLKTWDLPYGVTSLRGRGEPFLPPSPGCHSASLRPRGGQ